MSLIFAIYFFRDVLDFSVVTYFQVSNLNFFCMESVKQHFPTFWGKKIHWESNNDSKSLLFSYYLAKGQENR